MNNWQKFLIHFLERKFDKATTGSDAAQSLSTTGQILAPRNLSALPITETDDRLIAAAAIIGESSTPRIG